MGDVVKFPSIDEQWRRKMDAGFAATLRHGGYDTESIAWILSEWHARITTCETKDGSPEELLASVAAQLMCALADLSTVRFSPSAKYGGATFDEMMKHARKGRSTREIDCKFFQYPHGTTW